MIYLTNNFPFPRILKAAVMLVTVLAFIFASAFKAGKKYVITDFGATGDSVFLNTKAIQSAIDKCSTEGGGTVVVPAGIFISGSVFLKQGVSLQVAEGGVLKGSLNPGDYPQIDTRWEGEERKWTACLVNAIGLRGIKITGPGRIDGSGELWNERARRVAPQPSSSAAPRYGRPRLIGFQNCTGIEISGLYINNQASWGVFVLYSRNVKISKLKITAAHTIPSSDGIDIDSSQDVLITGCDIDVNDDCISIKAGKDEDGLRVNRPSEDILVEKCRFGYGHGGVAMGSETSGGIRNVLVRNCVAEAENWAPIRFKSQPSRGGVVENITYKDITLKNTKKAFEFNMAWRMVNPKPPAKILPVVRNVKIINVSGTVATVGDMNGLPESPVLGVTFKKCTITASKGFVIGHARNVDLAGLKIVGVTGEPIIRNNIQ
ncbi:glycoside hydrolase family 28 protein [Hufsiella ginkgonis]|uniref:Rhamnogalacturonase A/B/Epimerase-like pectate lyase domain-containing protein n=1 Tax=Hufsiella ginkgonis TaxID=2695274 RepID=A0A7K1XZZ7_9SPHI|nr:glycoside hydrolase family 28 protein [Hufsiella ginkgonis]MXV16512.1 hypothetical protein [Hufsiella ginkgonis]